jgi:TonB-dependent starch-binding outer membrane protein SusC
MRRIMFLLVATLIGLQAFAQTTISGTVTDVNGEPVPGANVRAKGYSDVGTITDLNGTYSLNVPTEATIVVVSFVGMKTQEVEIAGQAVVNVQLENEDVDVGEVVVTAYGSKGKVGLKGAISTVGSDEIEQVPMASFDQILQGKSTGLYVGTGSGQPGSEDTKVRIRGTASMADGANDPLYVIDGVMVEAGVFGTMNSNDFETVSVLKDASATSIYGSRASNGVILITTKRGKAGSTEVNYRFQTGWSHPTREKFDMMNSEQKLWFEELAQRGQGWALSPDNPNNAGLSAEELAANVAELERLKGINTEWNDVFMRVGRTNSHDLSISGGNEKARVYFALQRFEQEGIGLRSNLERTTGRLNVDYMLNDKVRFGISSSLGYSTSERIESEGGVALANSFAAAYLANPYEELYVDGEYNTGSGNTGSNAYERLFTSTDNKNELKGVGAIFMEADIIKGLSFKSQYGIDFRQRTYERWVDPTSYSMISAFPNPEDEHRRGSLDDTYTRRAETTFTNTLDYKNVFADLHTVGVLLGSEFTKKDYKSFFFEATGLEPLLPQTPAGVTPGNEDNTLFHIADGSKTQRALFSLFAIANYTFDDRYTLSLSVRRDGSSAFGPEYQHAILYSAGLTWDVANEGFMSSLNWIDDLKFRISYGTTGNQEGMDDFQYRTSWTNGVWGPSSTLRLGRAGYPQIKWEIGNKFNVGLDFTLFTNRLRGTLEFYNDITSDLFIEQTLSITSAVPGDIQDVNQGKMLNRGVEIGISGDIIKSSDLYVTLGANLTYNQNEILDLGQVEEFESGTSIIKKGLPFGTHYIVKWAGVDPMTGNPLYYTKDGQITSVYDANDAVTDFGTSEPPFTGGFYAKVGYKGFTLSADFYFAQGYSRFNNQTFFQENPNFSQFNLSTIMLDIWQQPGDITEVQRLGTQREFSSKDIEDASFLRFRNLTLAYNLPAKLLDRTKVIKRARVYAQAQNLYTWTKFTGFDPEDNNNIAQYEYPVPRIYTVGFDITF